MKRHGDKEHRMIDRASRHVLSTYVPSPPPGRPVRPHHRTPVPPENKTKTLRHGHKPRCDTLCNPEDDGLPQSAWRAAPAVVTGGGWWGGGGCGTAVGMTSVGWPTAGSCTTRSYNLFYSPTCHETCLDKCWISAEQLEMFQNTSVLVFLFESA